MKMEKPVGRSRGLSSPAVPLSRGNSFNNDSNNNNNNNNNNSNSKGLSLSHSLHQITSFMSTSFPHRSNSKTKDDKSLPSPEVVTLKEEFERKIAAVVFCLEEKAEENIDLSYKLKALQETSKQRESEKDRAIEDLHKALKSKEEECVQLEKKADNDEVLNELNRRIQTLTHCLNDMAEENLKLRTTVNANTNSVKQGARPNRGSTGSPFSPSHSSSSFSMEPEPPSSASFLSNLTASSTILSVARSSSSPSPSSCAPSTSSTSSSTSSSSSAPPSAHLKAIPATSSVSTNTSPVVTPAPAPPVKAVTLPDAVADMKSEIIAEELLKEGDWVKKFSSSYLVPVPPSNVLNLLSDIIKQDKARTEAKVKLSLDERITELESELKETEETLTTVKTSLAEETDRRGSLAESVEEYERKLKDLEGRMWDNLNKEAQRRTDAESKAKRLKKKVDELQFLLDELKDDGSDEEEDDEEEQAPQEENNNNNNESSDSTSSDSSSSSSSSEEPQSKEDQQ